MTREKKILFEICFISNNLFNDLKECDLAMGGFLKFPVDTLLSLNTMSIKNPFQLDKYFVSEIVDKKKHIFDKELFNKVFRIRRSWGLLGLPNLPFYDFQGVSGPNRC